MADKGAQMSLAQKLAAVRRTVRNIEKKGENTAQGYKFMRAEDVAGDIGDQLADLNVILTRENLTVKQDVIEVERFDYKTQAKRIAKDTHTIVTLDFVFIDGDSGERMAVASAGEGRDSGDKSLHKAFTSALKYALTQPLMMRVGDDPEVESDHDKDTQTLKKDNKGDDFLGEPKTVAMVSDLPPQAKAPPELRAEVKRVAYTKFATKEEADLWIGQQFRAMEPPVLKWGSASVSDCNHVLRLLVELPAPTDPAETFEG